MSRPTLSGRWLVAGALAMTLGVGLAAAGRGAAKGPMVDDPAGVAEARALVSVLEERARAAQEDLEQAKALLARLEGVVTPSSEPEAAPAAEAAAEAAPAEADAPPYDTRLEGVWRIKQIGGNMGAEFRDPPYDEYKIMSAGHYFWLSFDRESGEVLRSGGGTYTLDGDRYKARVELSNADDLRQTIGQEYEGTSRIEGDRCYHFGTMPNGAVFDELWERVH